MREVWQNIGFFRTVFCPYCPCKGKCGSGENASQRKPLLWHNYVVVRTKIIFAFQNFNNT